ncbi:hypothetical protein DOJK_01402 [Patescibacteria group bacterium]|nr:hypothetical protein DOJK_01402 [Patescibacteria group bacterium]
MRYFLILFLLLAAPFVCAESYETYYNERYDYSIDYPKDILFPQGESDNGDGQIFLSKTADAQLSVYANFNALEQSLEEAFREQSRGGQPDDPHKVVTYKMMKEDWFVVSGYREGKVFYQKTILHDDIFKTFLFIYDEDQKDIYDAITKRLAASFKD